MYEVFGVSYGWHVKDAELSEYIQSDGLFYVGGRCPYTGVGEPTIYIGVDIDGIDCGTLGENQRLGFDDFTKQVKDKLDVEMKSNEFLMDIGDWRNLIVMQAEIDVDEEWITSKELSKLKKIIKEDPYLFWTYSTS